MMSETAEIYTWTVINSSTEAFKGRVPYLAAIVSKPDGTRVAALVDGWSVGMPVDIGAPVVLAGEDALGNPVYRLPD